MDLIVLGFDEEKNIYELASQACVLNVMFSRNGFDKLNSKDFNVDKHTFSFEHFITLFYFINLLINQEVGQFTVFYLVIY
jgi:hypothetical protein